MMAGSCLYSLSPCFLLFSFWQFLEHFTHCFFTRVLSFPCRFLFFVSELSFDFWPEKDTLADWMLQQQQQCTRSLLLLPPKPDITFCCSLRGGGWSLLLLFLDLLESIGAAVAAAWQMASSYHQCQWGECVCVCVQVYLSVVWFWCVLPDWHSNDHERVFLSFSSSVELWLNWLRHLSLSSERFRPGKEAQ